MHLNTSLEPKVQPLTPELPTRITIASGDGIGREIMDATLSLLDAAGAQLEYEEIEIGKEVYLKGTDKRSNEISSNKWPS